MPRTSLLSAVALFVAAPLFAQTPAGPQFPVSVSGSTTDGNARPSIIVDAHGQLVVTWEVYDTNDFLFDVVGRRFAANGAPLSGVFAVNTYTTGQQALASLVSDGRGGFVVAWRDGFAAGYALKASRADAAGRREADVTLRGDARFGQALAPMPGAGYVVVWPTLSADPNNEVFGQRFDSSGRAMAPLFLVSSGAGLRRSTAVASAPDGRFVVAWNASDGSQYGIHAQRFAASGQKVGAAFVVNTATAGNQWFDFGVDDHVMAMAPDGSFVVTWLNGDEQLTSSDVFIQRFNAAGNRLGGAVQVNTSTAHRAFQSRLSMDRSGNFVVTWIEGPNSLAPTVRGRRFEADGTPRGVEFEVGTAVQPGDRLRYAQVDSDPAGNLVFAWQNTRPSPDSSAMMARRFGGLLPVALAVDPAGNGVLEPGETAALLPSWRNVNGAAQTFAGTLRRFDGPAGGSYTIADAAADYGTVADGATAQCGVNCYTVAVGGTRPAAHWDATAKERLLPDALGQEQTWPVHLGDSFSDVPRASAYYRAIETLLHRDVSGGCASDRYCPALATDRGQMAVFALRAREGGNYVPTACGTPRFADVPASSPYCPYIEELARRGITGGCGGNDYCPTAPVSREQMAVFMLRTLDPALLPPACGVPAFADVPASSPYCRWIEELARRGVTSGCGGGNYCPSAAITREQMSVFLSATFGLTLYGV